MVGVVVDRVQPAPVADHRVRHLHSRQADPTIGRYQHVTRFNSSEIKRFLKNRSKQTLLPRSYILLLTHNHTRGLKNTESVGFLEGRKEMFYLTTHSTHFIYVRHMAKDNSDSERGNPLLPHGLLFPISSKGS